jgi:hypothetical protein
VQVNQDRYQEEMLRARRADEIFDRLKIIDDWVRRADLFTELNVVSCNDSTFRPDISRGAVLVFLINYYDAERTKLTLELDALYPDGCQ